MKNYLTKIIILTSFLSLAFSFVACNSDSANITTFIGAKQVSEITTLQLTENLNNKNVSAKVTLNNSTQKPALYSSAELWIDGVLIGVFVSDALTFTPSKFGDIDCEIIFYMGGEIIKTLTDTLKIYIETGFIQYNSSGANGDKKDPIENGEVILTPSNVTLGSSDMIWAYDVRVPKGKTISFDYIATKLNDNLPNFGKNLAELHFRLDDYKTRSTLHPGDPYYARYIDIEPDKWLTSPLSLGHGIYTVFVCPNFKTDRNLIKVIHSSDFSNGTFTANYKSIITWPSY